VSVASAQPWELCRAEAVTELNRARTVAMVEQYEIDLTNENAEDLREIFDPGRTAP
jgi:hypothetical protein